MHHDATEEAAEAAAAMDLLPTLFRFLDAPDGDAATSDLADGIDRVCAAAAQRLLHADPATSPDDAVLANQAVLIVQGKVGGGGDNIAAEFDDDQLLAWATYAYDVFTRQFGAASRSSLKAGDLLVRVRERRREFDAAIQLRKAHTCITITRGEPHASRAMLALAWTLHHAGQCAEAADMLRGTWRDWQQHPGGDRVSLRIVMELVVLLAACGRTRDALHHLASAAPYRPQRSLADVALVQVPYRIAIAERRDAHRGDCTWPADPADPDVDWRAVLAGETDPTAELRVLAADPSQYPTAGTSGPPTGDRA